MTQSQADRQTNDDSARPLDLRVFFFDLESALDRPRSTLARDPEHLRAFCRRELEAMGSRDVLIFGATGFYLLIRSREESAALAVAQRLSDSLNAVLFGRASEARPALFQIARPSQINPNGTAPTNDAVLANEREEETAEGPAKAGLAKRSRDSLAELALRGTLLDENVELTFTPVRDLLRGRTTTFFCVPAFCVANTPVITGYQAFEGLAAAEMPSLDRAMLAHSLKFARRLAQDNVYAGVGTPVSFETLVSSSGRMIYQEAMRAAGVAECPHIFVTIRNIPSGVTASRLADIIGCLRPLVRHIFVQLPDVHVPVASCGYLGASGFSLRLAHRAEPSQVEQSAQWLGRVCEAQTALSCIECIDEEPALELVKKSAIRYGAGSALGQTSFRGHTHSLDIETFMRAASRAAKSRPVATVVELRQSGRNQSRHLN